VSEIDCSPVRPLLPRIADGEASPAEAMRVARHLPDCTACRILLARERRLASMLEEELEDWLLVGEEFVREVMTNLPQEPPPRPRTGTKRRTLKLAGLVGFLVGLPALAMRGADLAVTRTPGFALPRADALAGDGGFESIFGLSRLLLAVAELLGRQLPPLQPSPIALGGAAVVLLLCSATCGLAGTTLVALASHRISQLIR
jgi:hypothetical protein